MGLGVPGESKTLAWGFAMAPHRLRALVGFTVYVQNNLPTELSKMTIFII